MTPDERHLINDLFERLNSYGSIDKDREAESFINQSMRNTPDAAYKLVQSMLINENALNEQAARVEELEAMVQELHDQLEQMQQPQQQPRRGGSFLGGAAAGRATSVPQTSSRDSYQYQQPEPEPRTSPWGSARSAQPAQQPTGGFRQAPAQQPQYQPPQQPTQAASGGGGGFFRGALATAAGVAGGVLAAGAIKDMFGGSSGAHASEHKSDSSSASSDDTDYGFQSADDNDPGTMDDSSSDMGGSDDFEL
ncbi:MAG: DUF2076 domain-containing protein [Hyphomicrobiaceae bacterium]